MPAKFYYVLAFREGVIPLFRADDQPHFLGKTSDLSFKTEPDKTIDLDDGSTEVGSEKLTLSFSILGAIDNPWPLGEIWLVPFISNANYQSGGYPAGDILRIFFRDADDYRIETKSGEFELTRFSATIRYAADAPAYAYYTAFFDDYRIHLFPDIEQNVDDLSIQTDAGLELATAWYIQDRMIANQCALVSPVVAEDVELVVNVNSVLETYSRYDKGLFIIRSLHP